MLFGYKLSFGEWCTVIGAIAVVLSYAVRLIWCVSVTHNRVLRIEVLEKEQHQLGKRVDSCEGTLGKHGVRLQHLERKRVPG